MMGASKFAVNIKMFSISPAHAPKNAKFHMYVNGHNRKTSYYCATQWQRDLPFFCMEPVESIELKICQKGIKMFMLHADYWDFLAKGVAITVP